jgi:hypothetical protein
MESGLNRSKEGFGWPTWLTATQLFNYVDAQHKTYHILLPRQKIKIVSHKEVYFEEALE